VPRGGRVSRLLSDSVVELSSFAPEVEVIVEGWYGVLRAGARRPRIKRHDSPPRSETVVDPTPCSRYVMNSSVARYGSLRAASMREEDGRGPD